MLKRDIHPLAGKRVKLKVSGADPEELNGQLYVIEDWWQNIAGKSWMVCGGNPACLKYAIRIENRVCGAAYGQ